MQCIFAAALQKGMNKKRATFEQRQYLEGLIGSINEGMIISLCLATCSVNSFYVSDSFTLNVM